MDAVKAWTAMDSCGHKWTRLARTLFVFNGCKWTGKTGLEAKNLSLIRVEAEGLLWTTMDRHGPKFTWTAMDHDGPGWIRMEGS